jgi:hypothetical protein
MERHGKWRTADRRHHENAAAAVFTQKEHGAERRGSAIARLPSTPCAVLFCLSIF